MTTDNSALEKLRCLSAGGAKKVIKQFLRNKYVKWKVDDDGPLTTDDDGQLRIRKAPLPFGWQS